jgi:hypothetical protein
MRTVTGIVLTATAVTIVALVLSGQGQGKSSEAVACSTSARVILLGKPLNLTGLWKGPSGGRYWIRQVGSCIWWYGESPDGGTDFTNVLFGTVSASGSTSTIVGVWADVPKGENRNFGTMILGATPTRIVTRAVTGGFSRSFSLARAA